MVWVGESAALGAAIVWAMATWLYGQFSHRFSALQLNMIKGVIASAMMILVLPVLPHATVSISPTHAMVLGLSGIIGIAIGDSAYFASLKRIGPNNTLLLESLAPPLSGILALMFLGVGLHWLSWSGVIITTLAVTFAIVSPGADRQPVSWSGIGFGLLASVCQASGVVISHFALVAGDVNPLLGALLRLGIGCLAISGIGLIREPGFFSGIWRQGTNMSRHDQGYLLLAIFIGTFCALWLQQVALKYANPAIAQTLIATSPLFMLVIYRIKGKAITLQSALGTLLAVFGIALMLYPQSGLSY